MKNTEIINNFIYETILIDHISDIVTKLENKEFRDCDIKWLNNKLYNFTAFAAETLGVKFEQQDMVNEEGAINEYVTEVFLKAFNNILNYFKSI